MSRRAMTLSEVVLALAILVVAVIGIATFVVTIHRSVKEGKYQSVGSTIAQSELERLRLDSVSLANLVATPSLGVKDHLVTIDDFEVKFHQVVTATDVPSMGSRYLRVLATVSWEQSSRQREVVLESCYPKP